MWTARRHHCVIACIVSLLAVVPLQPAFAQRLTQPPAAKPKTAPAQKASPTPAKRESPVPFAPGETLTFDVSWSSYITAGTATMKVVEKKPSYGSVAYYIVAEGQPGALLSRLYELYYKADTLLDAYSLLPQRGSVFSREGKRQRMKTTMFDRGTNMATYTLETRTVVKKQLRAPAYAQDPLGAVYVLRALSLKSGDRFNVPICDGGKTYTVSVAVSAPETVKTDAGEIRAWKITPALPKEQSGTARRLTLWLSDDARRLPVKMQAQLAVGTFDLTLRNVQK
jgi:hypothetical protein